jgi:hypothetical protein
MDVIDSMASIGEKELKVIRGETYDQNNIDHIAGNFGDNHVTFEGKVVTQSKNGHFLCIGPNPHGDNFTSLFFRQAEVEKPEREILQINSFEMLISDLNEFPIPENPSPMTNNFLDFLQSKFFFFKMLAKQASNENILWLFLDILNIL